MDLWGTCREKWKWVELGLHHVQRTVNGCDERLCSATECSNVWPCKYLIMLAVCTQKSPWLTEEGLKKRTVRPRT